MMLSTDKILFEFFNQREKYNVEFHLDGYELVSKLLPVLRDANLIDTRTMEGVVDDDSCIANLADSNSVTVELECSFGGVESATITDNETNFTLWLTKF